ncbi:MAG: hypothetical protein Q9218_003494 [Villophora microphyllina]
MSSADATSIFDRLCVHLSIGEIIRLTRTCKALSHLYRTLVGLRHWNVDRDLLRFVKDPWGFRSQLARYDGLISGSFALQFFERVCWEESNLDIFSESGEGAQTLEKYLKEKERYCFINKGFSNAYNVGSGRQRHTVRTFERSNSDGTTAKAQIITSHYPPLQAILRGFHGTHVINILTWNKAYALFPNTTFIIREGVALKKQDEVFQPFVEKYEKRNYRLTEMQKHDPRRSMSEIVEIRRPGDRLTWSIPFDTTGMEAPNTPAYVLEHSAFGFDNSRYRSPDTCSYNIEVWSFEACILRYRYTQPNLDGPFRDIQRELDRLKVEKLQRLPADRQPPNRQFMMPDLDGGDLGRWRQELLDNDVPGLKYYDDQMPRWYAEWEQRVPPSARISMAPLVAEEGEQPDVI